LHVYVQGLSKPLKPLHTCFHRTSTQLGQGEREVLSMVAQECTLMLHPQQDHCCSALHPHAVPPQSSHSKSAVFPN